ncbi:GrpB family protein [Lysinibacillus agricola]|uniref:GrpB family protein n=1 Tax=Lysinibacillus agricola TaxID=2590012 RepID=UPI003C2926FE
MKNIKVVLSEYNPYWEEQYAYEKNRIVDALGNKVVGMKHIGSTSIRGNCVLIERTLNLM